MADHHHLRVKEASEDHREARLRCSKSRAALPKSKLTSSSYRTVSMRRAFRHSILQARQ